MEADILIIGGGIAGATLAFHMAGRRSVILLERETSYGTHATGRSAAEWSVVHASGVTRTLTKASHAFLSQPPAGFSDYPLIRRRGNLIVARSGAEEDLQRIHDDARDHVPDLTRLSAGEAAALSPFLDRQVLREVLYDPTNCEIDVDALFNGFLRGARAQGALTIPGTATLAGTRAGGRWQVEAGGEIISAAIVVNAAGPWADEVAGQFGVQPLGLVPRRRTAITFDPPDGAAIGEAASADDVGTGAYIKPEGGRLMASPGDATDSVPCDAAPEEIDVATAAMIAEEMTGHPIRRIVARWAGLRTFTTDGQPVAGWDASSEGFFWLAGLGGAGLMISPALGTAAAALIEDGKTPHGLQAQGVTAAALSPRRLADPARMTPPN